MKYKIIFVFNKKYFCEIRNPTRGELYFYKMPSDECYSDYFITFSPPLSNKIVERAVIIMIWSI